MSHLEIAKNAGSYEAFLARITCKDTPVMRRLYDELLINNAELKKRH